MHASATAADSVTSAKPPTEAEMDRHLAQIEKYMEELAAEYNAAMKKECCDDPDCPHCRPRCPTCGRLMGRAKKNKGA